MINKSLFVLAIITCVIPFMDPPLALLLGFIIAQTIENPFEKWNSAATNWLLKSSIVSLGFGMNLHKAFEAGKTGFIFTIFSIVITLIVGWLLGKRLGVDSKTSFLISSGTAICGGSAIAAVSPILQANEKQMSVSLGTVFILNSIALLLFPVIGHLLNMSEHQFGLWAAVAIHDTSSVVGAASKYGQESLQVATTVKLARALYIIPLSLLTAYFYKSGNSKIKIPYFIGLFIITMVIGTYFPAFNSTYSILVILAKKGLTITLFLIGSSLSIKKLKSVGVKPLMQGIGLWIFISIISLISVLYFA
jgi:Kef-type K+ transport system membrane component KefB